ncbi:MAG: hypothetical protein IJK28_11610 [Clostridia bacterium]|nr:hypothetical protein [Clostridia bacterium]
MRELMKALTARFSGLGMPLFLSGWVPADAHLPYLTLTVEPADWRRPGYAALTAWVPAEEGGNARRFEAMERIAALIPRGGLHLPYPGGICILRRARADFLRLVSEPGTSGAVGGQVRFEIVRYPTGQVPG